MTFGGGVSTGLEVTGFVEGQNVVIEYRWAEDHYDRLPGMAADLVRCKVNVISAITTPAALAAEATHTTIPIIFDTAGDPVRLGLVASLNLPAGTSPVPPGWAPSWWRNDWGCCAT